MANVRHAAARACDAMARLAGAASRAFRWFAIGLADADFLVDHTRRYYERFEPFLDPAHVRSGLLPWEAEAYGRFLPASGRIAVIGCGSGRVLRALESPGRRLEGVDVSARAISLARELLGPDVRLHAGDVRRIELGEGEWDAFVFSWFTYAYLPGRADRVAILSRLRDRLSPGGRIVVSAVRRGPEGASGAGFRAARWLRRATRSPLPLEDGDVFEPGLFYQHRFAPGELANEAAAAGLAVVEEWTREQTAVAVFGRGDRMGACSEHPGSSRS